MPQRPNIDQIKKAWGLKRQGGKTQQAMAEELGLDPRTVSNYFKSSWLVQRNLGHLRYAGQEPQSPRSDLENRAWELCESGEHAWMEKELYNGHAYTESESAEELKGFGGSTLKAVYLEKCCHFCGLVTQRRKRGFIVV